MSFVYLCLFVFASHLYAQEELLDAVEVSAEKNISEYNFSKPDEVKSSQLEAEPSGLVAPSLLQSPSVIASQNGGPGGRISFFIRGTEARHVSFTVDGLKANDPSNVDRQFDAAFFSSPFLKEIKIHKGPQAVLYGSDAIGGLVEMISRKGDEAPETRVDINAGSFGTVSTSISNDWGTKNHQGTITGTRFHTDGISRLNEKRYKATERDGSDSTQLTSSSRHKWSSKVKTDLLFSVVRAHSELDSNTADNSKDENRSDQYLAQQKTSLQLSKSTAVSLRNGLNRHNRIIDNEFFGTNSELTYEGNIIQNELLFKYKQKDFDLLTGLSSEHEELKSSGVDREFDLSSVFLQSAYSISHFKMYGGARAEKHVRYGSFYTGSGGVAYFLDQQKFFLQYSQGFKAPSLYQLYGPSFPGFPVGNLELTPEINHAWEGGWNLNKKEYEASVTFFQNRLSNLITYTPTNGYFNQAKFIAEGVELSGKYKFEAVHFLSSFTHQQFRKEQSPVLGRPLNSFMGGIAVYPNDSSEVSLKGRWFSARNGVDSLANTVKLNGYETFDFGYRYMFTKVDLGLQVLNLLNREYEDLYGYGVMPRSFFVHSGFRF